MNAEAPMSSLIHDPVYADVLAADIEELKRWCHGLSYAAGWWTIVVEDGGTVNMVEMLGNGSSGGWFSRFSKALVAEKLMLTVSEVAEAMEGHRKNLPDDKLPQFSMITVELADAMIRILDLAGALSLPLGEAFVAKLAFNTRREDHKIENRMKPGGKAY